MLEPPKGRSCKKIETRSQIPLKRQKFAGWEGRFTPAQDSQPFILELLLHC